MSETQLDPSESQRALTIAGRVVARALPAPSRSRLVSNPYPTYVVQAWAVREERVSTALQPTGWEVLVFEEEEPVATVSFRQNNNGMVQWVSTAVGEFPTAVAEALEIAASDGEVDEDSPFALIRIPQIGCAIVWFLDRNRYVPVLMPHLSGVLPRAALSEDELVRRLQPLVVAME